MSMKSGVSLVEVVVGLSLLAVLFFGISRLLTAGFLQSSRSTSEALEKSDMASLRSLLANRISLGDIRFSFFSGRPEFGTTLPFSLLAPIVQPWFPLCRNLTASSGICTQSHSLLFAGFDSPDRMLPAICSFPDGSNPHSRRMVFDLGAGPQPINFVPAGGSGFTSPAWGTGSLPMPVNSALALFDPPRASLWATVAAPTVMSVSQNPVTGNFIGAPPSPSCVANFRVLGPSSNGLGTLYRLDQLVLVRVTPLLLTDFMGSVSNVSASHIDGALGVMPARVFPVQLMMMGPKNETGHRAPASFGVNRCQYSAVNRRIANCATELVSVPNVEQVRVLAKYSEDFVPGTYQYQVRFSGQGLAPSCQAPQCLPLDAPGAIFPFLTGETLINMSGLGYSAMKQEFLQSLELRLRLRNRTSDEVVNVKLSP